MDKNFLKYFNSQFVGWLTLGLSIGIFLAFVAPQTKPLIFGSFCVFPVGAIFDPCSGLLFGIGLGVGFKITTLLVAKLGTSFGIAISVKISLILITGLAVIIKTKNFKKFTRLTKRLQKLLPPRH
jgi:hypothetical protein